MLHIKLKDTTHAATWWQTFAPFLQTNTSPRPKGEVKRSNIFTSRHVAYQNERNETYSTMQANISHTPFPLGVEGQFFSESGHVTYQIKGKEL